MNFIGSKTIETKRLILKKSCMKEQKKLWKILMIPEVNKVYLADVKKYANDKNHWKWETQKQFYESKVEKSNNSDVFIWSIFLKKDHTNSKKEEVIGQISCQESNKEISVRDIGWYIDPIYQRKGYATEAAIGMIDYMFNEVGIDSIESCAVIDNIGSLKIFENLGFSKDIIESHESPYTFYDGILTFQHYILTKKDYLNRLHIVDFISLDDYKKLIKSAGWKILSDKQHQGSLNNSIIVKAGKINNKVIGMARLVGDNYVHGLLCDVVVLDEYRGNGYGSKLVCSIINDVRHNLDENEEFLIELCPTMGKREFYKHCGFKYKPENMDGMYLWIKKNNNCVENSNITT